MGSTRILVEQKKTSSFVLWKQAMNYYSPKEYWIILQ
jgi:hypothetical protein